MSRQQLTLYVTPYCGFCHYVLSAIQQLGLEVAIRNVAADHAALEDLYNARGRTTVPVLRITSPEGEQWLPESREIVKYLAGISQAQEEKPNGPG